MITRVLGSADSALKHRRRATSLCTGRMLCAMSCTTVVSTGDHATSINTTSVWTEPTYSQHEHDLLQAAGDCARHLSRDTQIHSTLTPRHAKVTPASFLQIQHSAAAGQCRKRSFPKGCPCRGATHAGRPMRWKTPPSRRSPSAAAAARPSPRSARGQHRQLENVYISSVNTRTLQVAFWSRQASCSCCMRQMMSPCTCGAQTHSFELATSCKQTMLSKVSASIVTPGSAHLEHGAPRLQRQAPDAHQVRRQRAQRRVWQDGLQQRHRRRHDGHLHIGAGSHSDMKEANSRPHT